MRSRGRAQETLRRKQRLRIRYLLGLSGTIRHVTVDMLFDFFSKRYPDTKLRHESVQDVILELKRVPSPALASPVEQSEVGRRRTRVGRDLALE